MKLTGHAAIRQQQLSLREMFMDLLVDWRMENPE